MLMLCKSSQSGNNPPQSYCAFDILQQIVAAACVFWRVARERVFHVWLCGKLYNDVCVISPKMKLCFAIMLFDVERHRAHMVMRASGAAARAEVNLCATSFGNCLHIRPNCQFGGGGWGAAEASTNERAIGRM